MIAMPIQTSNEGGRKTIKGRIERGAVGRQKIGAQLM